MDQGTMRMARMAELSVEASPRVKSLLLAPLLLRGSLGAVFFAHGAQKLFGLFGGAGLQGSATGFEAMGLKPALLLALLAGAMEFAGAILLAVGLLTRPVAAVLALEMLFAILAVHAPGGFFVNWACTPGQVHGFEFNLVLIGGLSALTLTGAGRASLDGSRAVRRHLGVFAGPLVERPMPPPKARKPPEQPKPPDPA